MNTIEQQLWDYIDGNLDDASKKPLKKKLNRMLRLNPSTRIC